MQGVIEGKKKRSGTKTLPFSHGRVLKLPQNILIGLAGFLIRFQFRFADALSLPSLSFTPCLPHSNSRERRREKLVDCFLLPSCHRVFEFFLHSVLFPRPSTSDPICDSSCLSFWLFPFPRLSGIICQYRSHPARSVWRGSS